MSVPYGGQQYGPPRQVNFGWISESWRYVSQALGPWIVLTLIYFVITGAVGGIISVVFHNPNAGSTYGTGTGISTFSNYQNALTPIGQILNNLIEWLSESFFGACFSFMAVKQVKTGRIDMSDLFAGARFFPQFLGYYFVFGIISLLGCCLLVVGFFVVWGLLFPAAALIADGESFINAISRSFSAMSSNWLSAAGLTFVMSLLILVSALPCLLGLFVTLPMLYVMSALAYRDMIGFGPPAYGDGGYSQPVYPQAPGAWPPAPGQPQQPPYGEAGQPQQPYGQPQQPPSFGQPPSTPPSPGWPQQPPSTPPSTGWPQQPPSTQSGWPQQPPEASPPDEGSTGGQNPTS